MALPVGSWVVVATLVVLRGCRRAWVATSTPRCVTWTRPSTVTTTSTVSPASHGPRGIGRDGQTDPAIPSDLSGDPRGLLGYDLDWFRSRWLLVDHHFEEFGVGEFESADGWDHPDPLMRSDRVVFDHPVVDDRLGFLERLECPAGDELCLDGLVERLRGRWWSATPACPDNPKSPGVWSASRCGGANARLNIRVAA